jgi:glycosyltransferase involved in cell wall biosynthesis
MSRHKISVVVRCFNEEQHIGRLLTGVLKQTLRPHQIILVDSGSTDATLAIASRFPVEIHSIEPDAFSFGRSLNTGCRAANGELIVIVSAHVYPVYDTWLDELTAPFADAEVALAYGRQEGDERTKYSERQILARWFPNHSEPRQAHPFCNNANAAIRRQVWETQPYEEELTGLEDLDWAKRAIASGYAIAYVATAPVIHAHDESWSQLVNRYRREAIAHRRIYHQERMSAIEALRLAIGNIVSDYYHAIRDRAFVANIGAIPAFRVAQFWGTYRGFGQRGDAPPLLRRRFYYPHGLRPKPDRASPARGQVINYDDPATGETDARAD